MAKKKSNLELASISLSELMNRLEQYKAEFVECREDEARRKELLSRIGEIEKEILKRQKGKGEESAQQSKQQTEQNEASQKAPFNVNMTVQIGSILAVIVLAAVRFQVVREILIGFSLLVLTLGALSLIIGWLISRKTEVRLMKAASYTFLTLCVLWVLGTLMKLPEFFQGNVYWANHCLCFLETEEARLARLQRESEIHLAPGRCDMGEEGELRVYKDKDLWRGRWILVFATPQARRAWGEAVISQDYYGLAELINSGLVEGVEPGTRFLYLRLASWLDLLYEIRILSGSWTGRKAYVDREYAFCP